MFCSNCGTQVEEGTRYCPNCGAPLDTGEIKGFTYNDQAYSSYDAGTDNSNSSFNSTNSNGAFSGNTFGAGNSFNVMPLRTDRSLLIFILLSFVTCGIYTYIFMYQLIKDINIACEGDGEDTLGLLMYLLLTIITCGIYGYYWFYKVGNRLSTNAERYGFSAPENGTAVLLWMLVGQLLCGIGPFIAWNIIINNTNLVCAGYNRVHGMG